MNVVLSNPTNASLPYAIGTGQIGDATAVPTLSISDATVSE